MEQRLSNLGNRANILVMAIGQFFSVSSLKVSGRFFFEPTAKKGPVPSDGVVFAAWPARLSPQSARLTE